MRRSGRRNLINFPVSLLLSTRNRRRLFAADEIICIMNSNFLSRSRLFSRILSTWLSMCSRSLLGSRFDCQIMMKMSWSAEFPQSSACRVEKWNGIEYRSASNKINEFLVHFVSFSSLFFRDIVGVGIVCDARGIMRWFPILILNVMSESLCWHSEKERSRGGEIVWVDDARVRERDEKLVFLSTLWNENEIGII